MLSSQKIRMILILFSLFMYALFQHAFANVQVTDLYEAAQGSVVFTTTVHVAKTVRAAKTSLRAQRGNLSEGLDSGLHGDDAGQRQGSAPTLVIANQYVYSPYGMQKNLNHPVQPQNSNAYQHLVNQTRKPLNITHNQFGYTGQASDPSTSLMMLGGFRNYAPGIGQFIQPDTYNSFSKHSITNAFAYTNNNPLGASDPSGHWSTDDTVALVTTVAGVLIGAAALFIPSSSALAAVEAPEALLPRVSLSIDEAGDVIGERWISDESGVKSVERMNLSKDYCVYLSSRDWEPGEMQMVGLHDPKTGFYIPAGIRRLPTPAQNAVFDEEEVARKNILSAEELEGDELINEHILKKGEWLQNSEAAQRQGIETEENLDARGVRVHQRGEGKMLNLFKALHQRFLLEKDLIEGNDQARIIAETTTPKRPTLSPAHSQTGLSDTGSIGRSSAIRFFGVT